MPKRLTKEIFINKSIIKHGDKFNYSNVLYVNNSTPVDILCKEHGLFKQTPYGHMKGLNGCTKCDLIRKRFTKEDFIKKSFEKHQNTYDYSKVEYKTNRIPVEIICKNHGSWWQLPFSHMKGRGCEKCLCENARILNKIKFIDKSNKIHNNIYDYSKVNYINNDTKVIIICKNHGDFVKDPASHVKGQGCPICSESTGESKISKFLKETNIEFVRQKTFDGCVNSILLRFDFYLPLFNLCIEFNGKQHYEANKWFGGEDGFIKSIKRDKIKYKYCQDANINLLIIKYNETNNINNLISEKLSSIKKLSQYEILNKLILF